MESRSMKRSARTKKALSILFSFALVTGLWPASGALAADSASVDEDTFAEVADVQVGEPIADAADGESLVADDGVYLNEPEPPTNSDEAVESEVPKAAGNAEAAELEEPDATPSPAFSQHAKVDDVVVYVDAEEGAFPEGATLSVKAAELDEAQEGAVDAERPEGRNVATSYTFDIKVLGKDGEEVQPADGKKVEVRFALDEAASDNLEAAVYHHDDVTGDAEALEVKDAKADDGEDAIKVEAESFSLYTVEFTYGDLQYVLHGGESVTLADILSALNLTGEVTGASSSAPELLSVEESDGAWTVKSEQAFSSEETLIVMLDGVDYKITVTDDQTFNVGTQAELVAARDAIRTGSGAYIINVTADFEADLGSEPLTIPTGVTVTILGNDHSIEFFDRALNVSGGTLNLGTADRSSGSLSLTGNKSGSNGGSFDNTIATSYYNGGTVNMYGGVYISGDTSGSAGNVGVGVSMAGGTFNMYGGSISNCNNKYNAGAVFLNNGSVFNMYDGTISNNKSNSSTATRNFGAGVQIAGGSTFNMSGGTITGNFAKDGYGGGIYVQGDTSKFNMTGGAVYNNTAGAGGDDIWLQNGSLSLVAATTMDAALSGKPITGWYIDKSQTVSARWSASSATAAGLTHTSSSTNRNQVGLKAAYKSSDSVNNAVVTFKIVGGVWENYTTEQSVVLTSPFKLTDAEIPKGVPKVGYGNGKWTVSATAGTAPTNATPNTSYAFKNGDSIVYTLTYEPTVVNHNVKYQYTGTVPSGAPAAPSSSSVQTGASVTVATAPTLTGYTFSGWSTSDATISSGKFTMPDKDVTLSGSWTVKQYTITFNTNGGSTISPITQNYGTAVTAPANPTKTGYTFAGWDKTIPTTMPAENMTINAKWTAGSYTISYNLAGGSVATANPTSYTVESNAITLNNPTRAGYTFAGWTGTGLSSATTSVTIPKGSTGNRSYTATWEVNKYKITFDTDGGSSIAAIEQNYGTTVTAPANPTKTGYTFAGWDKTIPTTMPAENMTIKAKWTLNSYDVSYAYTGTVPSGAPTAPATAAKDYNTSVDVAAAPTYTGYTFSGWSTSDATVANGKFTMPAKKVAFTGSWSVNTYTIGYDLDGGSVSGTNPASYTIESDAITLVNPTKTGYTFAGWTGTDLASATKTVTIPKGSTGNRTYKATWTINQYTITFDTDGGSAISPITQDYATAVTAPANPTKTGYTFDGWDKTIPTTMPAENTTIKAKWKINQYTITFDSDGGSAVSPITQDYNSDVAAPDDPTKTGYTFAGWEPSLPSKMPAENTNVKAKWTINQYTITFDTDGGSAIDAITQDYNTSVTAPADPTKYGHTFVGWDKQIPATMPAENVTITAQWEANPHKVIYKYHGVPPTGAPALPAEKTYRFGETVSVEDVPELEGYTLTGGWMTNDAVVSQTVAAGLLGAIPSNRSFTMPDNDVVLTGTWNINQYTITFDTDGGSEVEPIYQDYATDITAPADPTKTGYTFAGWDQEIPATMPAKNVTIKATWTPIEYGIAYTLNGGSVNGENPAAYTIESDDITLVTPTRTGYTFAGWTGTDLASATLTVTIAKGNIGNRAYEATWTPIEYDIAYTLNGGSVNGENPAAYTIESDDITLVNPTRTGYTFAGWTGTDLASATTNVAISQGSYGNRAYEATWTINQYTITFDSDGGSAVGSITQDYNTPVTAPAEPTKEGHTFAGWDGLPEKMPAENVTATAKWTVNSYEVSYTYKGTEPTKADSAPVVKKYDYGTEVDIEDLPQLDGYTFSGWTSPDVEIKTRAVMGLMAAASVASNQYFVMPAHAVTLEGTWTINQYGIEYDLNGGEVEGENPEDYNVESGDITLVNPTRTGYVFAGWAGPGLDEPSTSVTIPTGSIDDRKYTATWSTVDYGIGYELNGGEVEGENPERYTIESSDITLVNPTRFGYTFTGWTGTDLDEPTMEVAIPTGSIGERSYAATWVANVHSVDYQYTGEVPANAPEVPETAMPSFSDVVAVADEPTLTGYIFSGWTTEDAEVQDGSFAMPDNAVVFSGSWTPIDYTIAFVDEDGTVLQSGPVAYDRTPVYEAAIPVKPADLYYTYEFAGWDKEITPVAGDATYTATYEKAVIKRTVSFDSNGGSAVEEQVVESGQPVAKPADPTREGHTFKGWQLDGKDYDFTTPVTGDIKLVAVWEAVPSPATTATRMPVTGDSVPLFAIGAVAGMAALACAFLRRRNA